MVSGRTEDAQADGVRVATADDIAKRQQAVERVTDAFIAHARACLDLPADSDTESVIAAYFASRAKAGSGTGSRTSGRWLEQDSALMIRLAKACNLFAGEPEVADLGAGHRRVLANALALALTHTIDWPEALTADPANGAAVFYDGMTLRNAARLSIKEAAAAIDGCIAKALNASPATQGLAALTSQLRMALIEDSTVSFEPLSETVRYGSREWVRLWTGIQACIATGMDAATLSVEEVMAYGQAVDVTAVSQARLGTGILLMAHAAGKVDLAQLREDNQAAITQSVQAFVAEEFKAEIALADAIDRLIALGEPPTARRIAENELKEKGLDPAAFVVEEPVSSRGRMVSYPLHDFYVKFNDLAEIEPNRFNRALIGKIGKNMPLFRDVYNRQFDAYISGYIDAHKKIVGLVLDMARKDGFEPKSRRSLMKIEQVRITSHPDVQVHGFFLSCTDGPNLYRYFFSSAGFISKLPAQVSVPEWLVLNRHAALTEEGLKKMRAASGSDANFNCVMERQLYGEAARVDELLDNHFRPRLLEHKKQNEPVQDGVSKADAVLEMVVPFYGVYTGLKRGSYFSAYIAFMGGIVVLVPTAMVAGKLAAIGKKSLLAGIQVAVSSFSKHGVIKGAALGIRELGVHLPSLGAHAFQLGGTLLDTLIPVPLGVRSLGDVFAQSYKHLQPSMLRKTAAQLREKFPRLAARLRARVEPSAPSGMKFELFRTPGERTATVAAIPNIGNIQSPFVRAQSSDGTTRWLRRFGGGYTQFDPHSLEPVGDIFVRGRDGTLVPSLPASEFARHIVVDPGLLVILRRTPVAADGTVSLNGKIFASIADGYVEIVRYPAMPTAEPGVWHTPRVAAHADGEAAGDVPALLVYRPADGGWISLDSRADDGAALARVLDRWTMGGQAGAPAKAEAIARVRAGALTVYGDEYADFLQARGANLRNALDGAGTPVDAAVALLGDGRFLHALLALDAASPQRVVLVFDMMRRQAMAGRGGASAVFQVRAAVAGYFERALQDLGPDKLRQLSNVLDAYGDRTVALLGHARSGNVAQQCRAYEIAETIDAFRRAVATRLAADGAGTGTGVGTGTGTGTGTYVHDTLTPPLTPDEYRALESLGLGPKPLPQTTLDELSTSLAQADSAFESAIASGAALTEREVLMRRETARTTILARLGYSLRKLHPANAEDARLLYRALLENSVKSINEQSFAALAGKYGIDADDVAGHLFATPNRPKTVSRISPVSLISPVSAISPVSPVSPIALDETALSVYRVAQPANLVLLPGELPLYFQKDGEKFFIRYGGDWYQVRWDQNVETWRIAQEVATGTPGIAGTPGFPVQRVDGRWKIHTSRQVQGGLSMPPPDILQRHRVTDAALCETLAKARLSEDGTILLGAKRYARIYGEYLELVEDRAVSSPERPIWRIAGASLPGTANGAPRLAWDKDLRVWHEPHTVPALNGGGGMQSGQTVPIPPVTVKRVMVNDEATIALADKIVMQPNSGMLFPIRVKNTDTVALAEQVLRGSRDVTVYPWWKQDFDDCFDIKVLDLEKSAYARVDSGVADAANVARLRTSIENDMRAFLTELYDRSETFRGLVNAAKAYGRLSKDQRWVIQIALPTELKGKRAFLSASPHITPGSREIVVPDVKSPPFMCPSPTSRGKEFVIGVIVEEGRHVPNQSLSTIVHEFMHFLTLKQDPDNLYERGVIEYLAQRVVKEAGINAPRRLIYAMPIDGESVGKLSNSEIERLTRYADAQDEYLAKRFPMPAPPDTQWNPAGNDRQLAADTSTTIEPATVP